MNWYLPPEEFDLFYRYYRDLFPEKSVKATVNYCRNPSPNLRPDGPYCYTQDGYELYMISAVLRENISKSFVAPDSRQDPLVHSPVSGLVCFRRWWWGLQVYTFGYSKRLLINGKVYEKLVLALYCHCAKVAYYPRGLGRVITFNEFCSCYPD